jgi:hypothetical protein
MSSDKKHYDVLWAWGSGDNLHRPQIYWHVALLTETEADRLRAALVKLDAAGSCIADPIVQAVGEGAMDHDYDWSASLHCFAEHAYDDGVALLKELGEDLRQYPEVWNLMDDDDCLAVGLPPMPRHGR